MNNNRTLSLPEQAMELLNRHNGSFNIVTISRIKGEISEECLRGALDAVQRRHPLLSSRIVGTLDNLEFTSEGTNRIPLRVVLSGNKESWEDIVRKELNESIDSSKVLLRCRLISKPSENNISYLITTVHHAISDGLSCISLQSEIFKYYQIIASENSIDVDCLPNLPYLEELLPIWMKGKKGVSKGKWFLLKLKLQMLLHKPERLESEEVVPLESRSCGMTHRFLEKELTQKLIEVCRQENTTVQGALCAAMLITVANKIRMGEQRSINVSSRSYVDLRRHLEPPINPNNMGFLALFLTSLHNIQPHTSFWELSRKVTQNIKLGLKRKDFFKPLMLFRKIVEYYIDHPDESPLTIAVTNIGKVNIPRLYGNLEIEEISFVSSNAIFGKIFTVAVATFNEKMFLNFIASKPSLSQETIEMLANDVINCLVEVCQEKVVRTIK
ncbi:phthiocerol/phthiodiolone dimycocerosyl transferase family protein [Microcoleus sp. FACHB-672]|uniref:phthiocerol/phthiodiolone dimycocerosyl transferase family protein n=1 Tax=Microcoleus sp. FACHB-672 TaxID=2692825 RepID=UPI00168622ED|nr:condensation domain-containing protein [Microcoleus sp. FACHB-672]MBD2040884.1 alcohol acetyltransferase [Microcoleus sp. FACHB-672]